MTAKNNGKTQENMWVHCKHSTKCCHKDRFLDSLADEQLWLTRLSFRKQVKALWIFARGYHPEQCHELLGLHYGSSVLALYRRYLKIVAEHQERENMGLQIGGPKQHCEADEVCFRCRAVVVDNVQKVEWLRYIAVIRHGSSKIYLEELPVR